jgi:hypothetical protein
MTITAGRVRVFKVGVFPCRKASFTAYTTWYNPSWSECCEHTVEAVNGTAAKKIAIQEHRERCIKESQP